MILTLTVNPAVDQTLWIDRLQVGCVNRPSETQLDPAGKGINVSRMVKRLGWPTVAFGFLGGEIGQIVRRALAQEHVQHHFVEGRGQTRINVTVNDRSTGSATSFYDPGPAVERDRGGVWHIEPPPVDRLSTVGSGDSLVAGITVALARGDDLEAALRLGTAAGAATAMSPGTAALGTAAEIARLAPLVRLRRL